VLALEKDSLLKQMVHMTQVKIPITLKGDNVTSKKAPIPLKSSTPKRSIPFKKRVEEPKKQLRKINFTGKLYEYQGKVLDWSSKIESGIIGLDMGLGKTATTISIICSRNYAKTIIVLPLSIIIQWKSEFKKFTDLKDGELVIYQGRKRKRADFDKARIVLTTYDVIRKDLNNFKSLIYKWKRRFDCIVLDEAHRIRNEETQTYEQCYDLGKHCQSKWLLTGTVIQNSFDDIATLVKFLNLKEHNYDWFKSADEDQIKKWRDMYYYRLMKEDCDIPLPEKSLHEHFLEFDSEHEASYKEVFAEVRKIYTDYLVDPSSMNFNCLLEKILRLRQCCNHPDAMLSEEAYQLVVNQHQNMFSAKFNKIRDIVDETPSDDKILIFSQWTHSLDLLANFLNKHGISFIKFNGKLTVDEKNEVVEEFREGSAKVMLVTITSGGVGLNLNCANHVIILDSWWNQALEEQAIDRSYRIGQTKKVEVHRLYMKDTIEEWMVEMKKEKNIIDEELHNNNAKYLVDKSKLKKLLHIYI
jgi:SNF2 family DNA or RNA helicase